MVLWPLAGRRAESSDRPTLRIALPWWHGTTQVLERGLCSQTISAVGSAARYPPVVD